MHVAILKSEVVDFNIGKTNIIRDIETMRLITTRRDKKSVITLTLGLIKFHVRCNRICLCITDLYYIIYKLLLIYKLLINLYKLLSII